MTDEVDWTQPPPPPKLTKRFIYGENWNAYQRVEGGLTMVEATATGLLMLRHELLAQVAQYGFAEVAGPVARTLTKEWLNENNLLAAMRLGVVGAASDEYVIYRTRDKR